MSTDTPPVSAGTAPRPPAHWSSRVLKWLLIVIGAGVLGTAAYFAFALNYTYATGERAGYVQKFSKTGWICKTWEGEMAVVNQPGATREIFAFSVRDEAVAQQISATMGERVVLRYDQHLGLPSCFGETGYYVASARSKEDGAPN